MKSLSFENRSFWSAILGLTIVMMGVALFYQYYLDFEPCVLCVHIRAWVIALGCVSAVALVFNNSIFRLIAFSASLGLVWLFAMDAYELWKIEAGIMMGTCSWSAGFPEFLPLNEWAPWLFEIGGLCGESPDMILGFTMAESLKYIAIGLFAFFGFSAISALYLRFTSKNKL